VVVVSRGQSGPAWSDIPNGSGAQWGGANWGERVAWVHSHLLSSSRKANLQWRELSGRRFVFRGLNEQLRMDVQNTMIYVWKSIEASEKQALDALTTLAATRLTEFRYDGARFCHIESPRATSCQDMPRACSIDPRPSSSSPLYEKLARPCT
jgi:hypothetical protein